MLKVFSDLSFRLPQRDVSIVALGGPVLPSKIPARVLL